MSGAAMRLTLEDFAEVTGLPLAALQQPLSQPPMQREPLPCAMCEERALEHAAEIERAQLMRAETTQALLQSVELQMGRIREDMHARQAKALDAVLSALLPELGHAILRQKLTEEILAALPKDSPITVRVSDQLDLTDLPALNDCTVVVDSNMSAGRVDLLQDAGTTTIQTGHIVKACLEHLNAVPNLQAQSSDHAPLSPNYAPTTGSAQT